MRSIEELRDVPRDEITDEEWSLLRTTHDPELITEDEIETSPRKTINQLIEELNSTDIKVETLNFDTPLKKEQRRQLDIKLKKQDEMMKPRLTEAEEMDKADFKLIQAKENI